MGQSVQLVYVDISGRFRFRNGKIRDKWVENHHDRQAHTISRNRVFAPNKPVLVDSVADLASYDLAPVPYEDLTSSRRVVVIEDNTIVPMMPEGPAQPALTQLEVKVAHQVTLADVDLGAAEATQRTETTRMWFNALMIAAMVGLGIIGFILITSGLGGGPAAG